MSGSKETEKHTYTFTSDGCYVIMKCTSK